MSIDKKGIPIKNIPFAGVGKPKKKDFDGKVLNLANLIIENGTIKKEINGVSSISSDLNWKKWNSIREGTTENVIKSEKESNWTPIFVFVFNNLARYPSKKSKMEPVNTKIKANS